MRKREGGNFLAGMGVGVLVGLAVSLGIAFYLNRTPIPFMTAKPTKAEKNGADSKKAPPIAGGLAGVPSFSACFGFAAMKGIGVRFK